MFHKFALCVCCLLLFTSVGVYAQEDDKLGTEQVDVIKPYTPEISDAFKMKEIPKDNDSTAVIKKEVAYVISSVPVASTFVPTKPTAARVPRVKKERLFDSYVSLSLGNFVNGNLDFYTSRALNRDETIDVGMKVNSSQGGINEVRLEDGFLDARVDVSYKQDLRDLNWGADFGYQFQRYNWYGLPDIPELTEEVVSNIDEEQNFQSFFFSGNLAMEDSYIQGGEALIRLSKGDYGAAETRAYANPSFEVPIAGENINLGTTLDWVIGSFDRSFESADAAQKFNFLKAGGSPSLVILRDNLTVNLGASVYFGWDIENGNADVFVYPNVTASYRIIDETLIAYAGVVGDLEQNSYYDFFQDNRYVSPTLFIQPTDKEYDGFAGIKGKLLPTVGYDLKASYISEINRPLFVANGLRDDFATTNQGYAFGNSFGVVYDDINTIALQAESTIDVAQNFKMNLKAAYFNYTTEQERTAWNLPEITASVSGEYQIEKWFAGADIFYMGPREDIDFTMITPEEPQPFATLDSFLDLNIHGGYRFNDQLIAFAKVNNIFGNNYERWFNTPVQGIQAMGGLTYKFDIGN